MRAPEFWERRGILSGLLQPLAAAHALAGIARRLLIPAWRAAVPVVCVGNLVAGGAGKTPVVISLADLLTGQGRLPHILSSGYGGALHGPLRVDPSRHDAADVGDEALLLARAAPTWVARDRAAGARHAIAAGAELLVLDDGFQNPSLAKDLSFIVVDGGYGFGNGRLIPAGPLRESISSGLARAQAAILIGADTSGAAARLNGFVPILRARLVAQGAEDLVGRPVFAFAGIGRPAKFRATLTELGARIVGAQDFPDHHPYREAELRRILALANAAGALPVTTAKDWVRLPQAFRPEIRAVEVTLDWAQTAPLIELLAAHLLSPTPHG